MARKVATIFIFICLFVGFTQFASAVTGNAEISVTDQSGSRLPGASIRLISKETGETVVQTETDSSGTALVSLEEGDYIVEVGKQKRRTAVTITGGQTSSINIQIPAGVAPRLQIPPTAVFTFGDEEANDIPITRATDEITDTINGVTGPTQIREGDPDDQNERLDFELNWNDRSGTFATGLGHHGPFHPFIKGSIGSADVSFTSRNLSDSSRSNTFEGDGTTYGIGGGVLILGETSPILVGAGYLFSGFYDLDLTRQNPLQVAGGAVIRDDVEISYKRHQIRLFAGTRVGPFYPYGGVIVASRRVEINLITEADFSQSAGFPVVRRIESTNKLEDDTLQGLVGVGLRQGRFLAGVEGSFGGGYTNFLFQAGIGF